MLPVRGNSILVGDLELQEDSSQSESFQGTKVWTVKIINDDGECELLSVEDGANLEISSEEDVYEAIQIDDDDGDFSHQSIQRSLNPVRPSMPHKSLKIGGSPRPSGWKVNRHKLRFLKEWYQEFPFLSYDEENNVMFCKLCRKFINGYRKSSPFIVGTDNFRISMIKYHLRSLMHVECQQLADALVAEDSDAMERDLYKDHLSLVFKSAYFIYKNKMPYIAFPQLCESLRKEGTEFPVYSSRDKACPLFGKFISMAYEKELARKVASLTEFSVIIDASFRRQIESHDMVYIKYIDGLIIQTVFLGVVDSSAKLHNSMYSTLTNLFKRYNLENWYERVVYIMTDKSDNHMWLEGFIEIIDNISLSNFISEVKYLPHKVKFCSNIVQGYKSASTVDALLHRIYCYYEKVDVSKKNLIHMNKVLEDIIEVYGNLPKNSFVTLTYDALKAVEEDWDLLVSLLSEEQQLLNFDFNTRKAGRRILKVITRSSFILKMAILLDIFSCLNNFSVQLGNDGVMPYDIHILLEEVCSELEKAGSCEGLMAEQIADDFSGCPRYFREIEIVNDGVIDHLRPEMDSFSQDLICYLRSLIDDTLLEKCFIFSISLWPDDDDLKDFGNSEFADIFLCFRGNPKYLEDALTEWQVFKSKVSTSFPIEVKQDSKSVLLKMLEDHGEEFPFVTFVLKKILLLSFEASEIKRGYQEMCLNKSHYRSVLSLQSLQTMMMISMHGPPIGEFDCSLPLDLFLNSRNRQFRKKIVDQKLNSFYLTDMEL